MRENDDFEALEGIKNYCLDCKKRDGKQVLNCSFDECWLYPFRLGENPYRKGNDEI